MLEVVVMAVAWFNPDMGRPRATEKSYLKGWPEVQGETWPERKGV
jgi:hypothetical protein